VEVGRGVHVDSVLLVVAVAAAGGCVIGAPTDATVTITKQTADGHDPLGFGVGQAESGAGHNVHGSTVVPEVGNATGAVALVDVSHVLFFFGW
jgi:hypothetical protein